jgi:hypothetical protein
VCDARFASFDKPLWCRRQRIAFQGSMGTTEQEQRVERKLLEERRRVLHLLA